MSQQEELTFALKFIADHPEAAIKIIEKCDIEAVAKLIEAAPPDYISPILNLMLPEYAARICKTLTPGKSSLLLATLDANAVAGILRRTDKETQDQILQDLPGHLNKETKLLLEFPLNTVGAWMSPHYLSVASDMKCKNILKYLKAGDVHDDSEYIFIVGRDGEFQGRTQFINILKSAENLTASSIMDKNCSSLPAYMELNQCEEHRSWNFYDVLPVTNRQEKLLGIMQHHTLRQALKKNQTSLQNVQQGKDPISSIFEVYGQSLLALYNTVSDAVDSETK